MMVMHIEGDSRAVVSVGSYVRSCLRQTAFPSQFAYYYIGEIVLAINCCLFVDSAY